MARDYSDDIERAWEAYRRRDPLVRQHEFYAFVAGFKARLEDERREAVTQ